MPSVRVARVAVVGALCAAQAFPAALFGSLLPAVMRDVGVPLTQFYLLSVAALPLWFKWLFAPLVDRTGSERIGRRRSWILPTTLLGAASYALIGSIQPTQESIRLIIGLLFLNYLVMSFQDIAVDGYTVENLEPADRPAGVVAIRIAQALGIVVPMLILMPLYDRIGWTAVSFCGAALLLLMTLPVLLVAEAPVTRIKRQRLDSAAGISTLTYSLESFKRFVLRRENRWVILLLGGYGLFSTFVMGLVPAFLRDKGLSIGEIGIAGGIGYLIAPAIGGYLSSRYLGSRGLRATIWLGLWATALLVGAFVWVELLPAITLAGAIVFALVVMLLDSPLGVVFDALRLKWASPDQAATDYTFQSTVYTGSKSWGTGLAGFVAGSLGYLNLYLLAFPFLIVVGWLFIWLTPRINQLVEQRLASDGLSAAGDSLRIDVEPDGASRRAAT